MTGTGQQVSRGRGRVEHALRLFFPLFWAVLVLWLSLMSAPRTMSGLPGLDKLLHGASYGLLAILLSQYLFFLLITPVRVFWLTLVFCSIYGGLIELLQWAAQAGRTAEWWDVGANILGALAGCVIFRHVPMRTFAHDEEKGTEHG